MRFKTIEIATLSLKDRDRLTRRSAVPDRSIRTAAANVVAAIRDRGDSALLEYSARFGGGLADERLRIDPADLKSALGSLSDDVLTALTRAVDAIRSIHQPQRPTNSVIEPTPGVLVERRWSPLARVGVYVPGGRASYPSSLLMGVVPAQIAGVDEIAVATPTDEERRVNPTVLGAAALLGIEEVYALGGAQAIGAFAYGTAMVPRVDKIVGPGGPWVTAAKVAVFGDCAIDLPAGPSEAVVVVDDTADPRVAAADLLCQAEHGSESAIALVATSREIANAIVVEAEFQVTGLARETIIRGALGDHGLVAVAADLESALQFANDWAPEHLTLHVADAADAVAAVPAAGSVFVGHWSPESAGDYATGANHVLPTGGQAAAHGPLSVEDFGSWRQVQTLNEQGLRALAPTIRSLAIAEGLTAHAHCVDVRLETA